MRVRLLTTPGHSYGSAAWPPVGEVVEVPEGLGTYMLAQGEAEAVKEHKAHAPEAAVKVPTERAVKPPVRGSKG